MKILTRAALLLVVAMGVIPGAQAALLQARATPARLSAPVNQDATLAITWLLTTDAGHTTGAVSAAGVFVNAATGATLGTENRLTIGTPAGAGPLSFIESVSVSAALLAQWRAQGVRLVAYRRTFVSTAPPARSAQVLLTLRGTGLDGAREAIGGELQVTRLDLTFAEGARVAMLDLHAAATAQLRVSYVGSGTLRARWEVADPASTTQPLYRTLKIVRENLGASQQVTLTSPLLPTAMSGRHLLRFCLEESAPDSARCTDASTGVQSYYEVSLQPAPAELRGIAPNGKRVDPQTSLRWPQAHGATIFRLQIFSAAMPPATEPAFIAGVLVPGSQTASLLDGPVRLHLDAGRRYLWRVSAHDADGQLIAISDFASFVWQD